jgi:hypothetical protein
MQTLSTVYSFCDRAQEARRLAAELEDVHNSLKSEIDAIKLDRKSVVETVESLNLPTTVNRECVVIRDRRKNKDHVNDHVQEKLQEVN